MEKIDRRCQAGGQNAEPPRLAGSGAGGGGFGTKGGVL